MGNSKNCIYLLEIGFFLVLGILTGPENAAGQSKRLLWQKALGGSESDYGYSLVPTNDHGFIVVGQTLSSDGNVHEGAHGSDVWLVKINATGNIAWQKCLGNDFGDRARAIEACIDGGFIIGGFTNGAVKDYNVSSGSTDLLISRIKANGEILWQKTYGGTGSEDVSAIRQTGDGGFIVAAQSNSVEVVGSGRETDIWILKLTPEGAIAWQHNYGGTLGDYISDIGIIQGQGYIVLGCTNSNDGHVIQNYGNIDTWVLNISVTGQIVWQKNYGGSGNDYGKSLSMQPDNSFLIAGSTNSRDHDITNPHGDYDGVLYYLSASGTPLWVKNYGGTQQDNLNHIRSTPDNGFIMTGFTASADIDIPIPKGSTDILAIKTGKEGNIDWIETIGGSNSEGGQFILPAGDGRYILTGTSTSSDNEIPENHGGKDLVLIALDENAKGSETTMFTSGFSGLEYIQVFPTATKGKINIKLTPEYEHAGIKLIDMLGREQKIKIVQTGLRTYTGEIAGLPPGNYQITVYNETSSRSFKITYAP